MDLEDLFDSFAIYAFRVEGLPSYSVEEEGDALRFFRQYGTVPDGFNKDWADLVGSRITAGKSMQRLRLMSVPPTEYERFEMLGYSAGISAGEDIRLTDRNDHPPSKDFWLFDDRWVALMNYSALGAWESATVIDLLDAPAPIDVDYWRSVFLDARPYGLGEIERAKKG